MPQNIIWSCKSGGNKTPFTINRDYEKPQQKNLNFPKNIISHSDFELKKITKKKKKLKAEWIEYTSSTQCQNIKYFNKKSTKNIFLINGFNTQKPKANKLTNRYKRRDFCWLPQYFATWKNVQKSNRVIALLSVEHRKYVAMHYKCTIEIWIEWLNEQMNKIVSIIGEVIWCERHPCCKHVTNVYFEDNNSKSLSGSWLIYYALRLKCSRVTFQLLVAF